MVLLQSTDKFDDLAELEPTTGRLTWYSKHQTPALAFRPIRGHVARLDGHTLILYREATMLHLRIDDADFELTDDTYIELVRGNLNVLTVIRRGVVLFSWTYKPPVIEPPLEMDPTPFVEEEHFDFGLFVYNVMRDACRRDRIYR